MLGMLVAVSGVGASVRARWMCSVRQSSASSEKYELVVMLVKLYTMYPYGFPIHKYTRILKLQITPDPLPHTTNSLAELSNTENGR